MTAIKEEAIIATRDGWLAQNREAPLQPELPIVDPHHHLWDRGGEPYFLPEFLTDTGSGHNIVATVYLECHQGYRSEGPEHLKSVGEVEFAASVAREAARNPKGTQVAAGIVAKIDLRLGEQVTEVAAAMREVDDGRLRGVRHISAWHADANVKGTTTYPPPGLMMDPDFRRGIKALHAAGLSFDAYALHTQLTELYDLAMAFPDLPIVMCHTGGCIGMGLYEHRRDLAFAEWSAAIRNLARAPNVHAKLGGFGMRTWGFGFDTKPAPPTSTELAEAIRPYVETCIESFGAGRCMFESNFPVDKGSFSYVNMWNAYKRLAGQGSATERSALLHDTAARFYKLS